ncbi:MAG: Ig-like domain-containing protein [Gemmatimonadaceae bacterium]
MISILALVRMRQHFFLACTTAIGLFLSACSDDPVRPPAVDRVEVSATTLALKIGEIRTLTATAFDARGKRLTTETIRWTSADPTVASVTSAGVVAAVGAGSTSVSASAGTVTATVAVDVELVRVARIIFALSTSDLLTGGSAAFRVTAFDSSGGETAGWTRRWTTADTTIARVDQSGIVQALRSGTTSVRVRVDTVYAEQSIRVWGSLDLAVTGLSFAQVIQNDSSSVPMIRGGGLPVVANVYVTADAAVAPRGWVRVRCSEGTAVRWEDSVRVDVPLETEARAEIPAVQLLMPNNVLGASMACVAEADPAGQVPDTIRANNRFPATGGHMVAAIEVPPLDITFVPIVLAADGGVMGNVTDANLEQYLITARQLLPLARVNARIGQPFTTNTQFGNGADAAWRSMLQSLESKRVVDGYRGHYYGVVRPGAGITSVTFGGFGYISGRTALSIQVGWFNREASARETVAHELGHNFGRPHAPCGGPAGPDPLYPYRDAVIGARGWDVYSSQYSSQGGALVRANAVPAEVRDLMSYCRPIWISDYSYQRMISGRQLLAGAGGGSLGDAILVRGEVGASGLTVEPLFAIEAEATTQAMQGVDLELVGADGRVLTRHRAPLLVPDHASSPSFVAIVRVPDADQVSAVRVRALSGAAIERRMESTRGAVALDVQDIGTRTRVRWDARRAAHLMVRDETTGELLAFATGGSIDLPHGGSRLRIAFSNGWRVNTRR